MQYLVSICLDLYIDFCNVINRAPADIKQFNDFLEGFSIWRDLYIDCCNIWNYRCNILFCLQAESAIAALNCSGVVLGSSPIRSDCLLFHSPPCVFHFKTFLQYNDLAFFI